MLKKVRISFYFLSLLALLSYNNASVAAPVYTHVDDVTNSSNPSDWKDFTLDITSLVSGATSAFLNFDLRNDAPVNGRTAHSTTSAVSFGVENSNYFVKFNYVSGQDSSHWRNVELVIDGLRYVDQYGANNNHMGDANYGTAWQGLSFIGNILGGVNGSTYVMTLDPASTPISSVPVPAAVWLFATGLMGLFSVRKRKA